MKLPLICLPTQPPFPPQISNHSTPSCHCASHCDCLLLVTVLCRQATSLIVLALILWRVEPALSAFHEAFGFWESARNTSTTRSRTFVRTMKFDTLPF